MPGQTSVRRGRASDTGEGGGLGGLGVRQVCPVSQKLRHGGLTSQEGLPAAPKMSSCAGLPTSSSHVTPCVSHAAARVGLMHIGVFILLLLSGERNFGVRLNKPYSVRVPMDIPVFTGTHADLLIVVRGAPGGVGASPVG